MPSKAEIVDLAKRFAPVLRFAADEKFFPINAEYWLAHRFDPEWYRDFPDEDQGTSLYLYDDGFAGQDYPNCQRQTPQPWVDNAPSTTVRERIG